MGNTGFFSNVSLFVKCFKMQLRARWIHRHPCSCLTHVASPYLESTYLVYLMSRSIVCSRQIQI